MMACPCIHSDEPYGEPIKPKGWDCSKGCFLQALVECPECGEKHAYWSRSPWVQTPMLITTCVSGIVLCHGDEIAGWIR